VVMMNPVAEKLTAWGEQEACGRPLGEVFNIINEETRGKVENPVKRVLREGTVIGLANHTILIARDGTERPIADCGSPIYDKEGKITGVVLVFRDETEKRKAEKAVAEALSFAQSIIATVREPLVVLDAGLRILSANRAFYRVFQVMPEETEGRLFYELGNRQWDIPELRRLLEDILPQNTVFDDYQIEHNFPHIGPRTMLLNARRISREANKTDMILLGIEDITERKRVAEEASLLNLVVQNMDDAVISKTLEGRILSWNEGARRVYGYLADEVIGQPISILSLPEREDEMVQILQRIRRGEVIDRFESERVRKDGQRIWVSVTMSPIRDTSGQIIGASTIARDITEHKREEKMLRESEVKLQELFDHAPVGYFEVDNKGNIARVNRTALEMLGYGAEEMVGQPIWKFITGEENIRQIFFGKIFGKIPAGRSYERDYIRKGGATLPVLAEDRLVRNEEGKITGIRVIVQDITERKKAEAETAALQEQLRQAQKMEAIGRLAGGIAHDFNNLLTVIQGNAQLALMDLRKDAPLRGNIEEIRAASGKAADLTRQLLAFSRKQIMEMHVLDSNLILQRLDKMLHRVLGEDIELVTFFTEGIGKVKADPGQIEQVIVNLAVNARDAMPEGGKLTIETANVELDEGYAREHIAVKPGRYVMLSVSDTGVGMTPEVKERVFEPFFTTKEMDKGTGLGLSTVYGIVKQSGGNIWVYSEPGEGTTFKIYLPQVDEPLTELKQESVKEIPRGNETVIVVEDEEAVRKLAVRSLKSLGYRVLEAPDGGKALLLCGEFKEPIHLIITDVVMPNMSGRKLVERLKNIHLEMKVLYMSGYTDNAILHHGVLEEGTNFIQKPFTLDGLARKVREVLEK